MTRALFLATFVAVVAGCGGTEENRYVGWGSVCGTCATTGEVCVPALNDAFPCGYVGWNPPFPTSEMRCTGTTASGWTCYTVPQQAPDNCTIGVICEKLR